MKTAVSAATTNRLPIIAGMGAYAVHGMGVSLLGVAWPAIRDSYNLALDTVGWLLLAFTVGHLLTSFSNGRFLRMVTLGTALVVGSLATAVGVGFFALAPVWWLLVVFYFVAGSGTGLVNPALNTRIAATSSAGLMNWLHASFGIGATVGPLLMTALITGGYGWRLGYFVAAALQCLAAVVFWRTRDYWQIKEVRTRAASTTAVSFRDTFARPLTWLSILVFFLYTGMEAATGQWSFVLFTEGRGASEAVAGAWVGIFWACITGGRLLAGVVTKRLGVNTSLRLSTIIVVAGALLLWQDLGGSSLYALAIIGAGLAAIFPLLMTATPGRLGREHAANAIGFQAAAAGMGASILPGLAGVLADNASLEMIGPFLVATAVALFSTHEVILHRERRAGA